MIILSNGHKFEYMVASGALGFDGKGWLHERLFLSHWKKLFDPALFTVVAKTVTFNPRKGNYHWYWPWGCIQPIFQDGRIVGMVNAVGLTNKGIGWWCEEKGIHADRKKIPLVGSILSDNIYELVEMAHILNDFDLVGLELNWSCPNTKGDFLENSQKIIDGCKAVKKVSRFPLILKLSVVHDIKSILPKVEGIVEAISINSVPWVVIFPDRKSPFVHLGGGGVSGKVAQPHTWGFVKTLVSMTSIPVIGPSVWEFEDIAKLRKIGAKAISFGSIFFKFPWGCIPTMYVRKDMKRERK